MANAALIALEGIDGSGTTTQAERLVAHLGAGGQAAHLTAEPSTGAVGLLIREVLGGRLPMNEPALALLFAADRLEHLEREIEPELSANRVVVTDRYLLSSLAYQSIDNPFEWITNLNYKARRPDLSILLRVSAETAAKRREERGGESERFDALDRQRRVADAYDRAFTRTDVGPTHILDAERDFDTVATELAGLVDQILEPSS